MGTGGESGTWHYGLMARWWAEFNVAEPNELAYFREAIKRFGEPVLDLGCGSGRILVPLLEEGFDVDGADVSADMIEQARALAAGRGFKPSLTVQPMHQLVPRRTYGTVYICGAFGLGSSQDDDMETLRRVHGALAPGGGLVITDHDVPGDRSPNPRDWPAAGERRTMADGDELELLTRVAGWDAQAVRLTLEMRIRLWSKGEMLREETRKLTENDYPAQQLDDMLRDAGFVDVRIAANYTDRPYTAGDKMVSLIARKQP
jgi:SAM-dependent methyltransferase